MLIIGSPGLPNMGVIIEVKTKPQVVLLESGITAVVLRKSARKVVNNESKRSVG